MPDSQQTSWSHNPDAPRISSHLYVQEKIGFGATYVAAMFYGMLVVLFLRCMAALFDPDHQRGKSTKWGIVSYTVAMFSVITALTGVQLDFQSICYIDNREFPGVGDALSPGPLGYQSSIFFGTLAVGNDILFFLNGWLADGLLLYRCYIIYSKNIWAIALPCLMYLGSFTMGILLLINQAVRHENATWGTVVFHFGLPYLSISMSLNILLTLMIIIRLALHIRDVRIAMGGPDGIGGLYKTVVTMLIESCALYTMSSFLVIGSWVSGDHSTIIFFNILTQIQVIAPLLIIQRVADKSALTSDTVVSGHLGSFRARNREELTDVSAALSVNDPMSSSDRNGENSGELGVGAETTIDFHQDN